MLDILTYMLCFFLLLTLYKLLSCPNKGAGVQPFLALLLLLPALLEAPQGVRLKLLLLPLIRQLEYHLGRHLFLGQEVKSSVTND